MRTLYLHPVGFFYLSSFFFFVAWSHPSQIGCLPCFHTWCDFSANLEFRMQVWNLLRASHWNYRTQKIAKNLPSGHIAQLCRAVSSQLRHVSTIRKKLVKQQYLQMSSQYDELPPLTIEIGLPVWGTPANFNWFRVLALLLQRRHSPEANQTLHDVWPSPGLVHYVYIFWAFAS